jgi:hypothetical protein
MEAPSSAHRRGTAGAGHTTTSGGGARRRFDTTPPEFDAGLDRHARPMDGWRVKRDGEVLRPRPMKAALAPFRQALAPSREARVVGVEGLFTSSWLAARCGPEGLPGVAGHALDGNALPGGQAPHARSEAHPFSRRRSTPGVGKI